MDGRISEIHDVNLEEFIAALDETEGLIFAVDYWQGTPP
jgi:mannose/fructose-specific phosphotransferase system component IIA